MGYFRPPPRTMEQRMSILDVHMKHMFQAGRVLVSDAPSGSIAYQTLEVRLLLIALKIHFQNIR